MAFFDGSLVPSRYKVLNGELGEENGKGLADEHYLSCMQTIAGEEIIVVFKTGKP